MKTMRKIVCGMLIAAPLFLMPAQSRAGGGIDDFFHNLFQKEKGHHGADGDHDRRGRWDNNAPAPGAGDPAGGNSVPINGGLILLMVAGLGLAAKAMNNRNKTLGVNNIL